MYYLHITENYRRYGDGTPWKSLRLAPLSKSSNKGRGDLTIILVFFLITSSFKVNMLSLTLH